MALNFVLGRSGAKKSDYIINEIKKKLIENPQGPTILYIVPDQMTFQQEYELFKDETIHGSIRAQVVSFSRLAWRVLHETGGGTKQFVSSIGIQMMLKKIIDQKESDFNIFQKAIHKQGFLENLENIITEFKRHLITPEMLKIQKKRMDQFKHKSPKEISLTQKLDDLHYIYNQLTDQLADKYIDSEDQLQILAEKINEAHFLKKCEVYIDGFHRFSPKELLVLENLLKICQQMTVSLTTDQATINSELDLFYQTTKTYHDLQQIATENKIQINNPIILQPATGRFKDRPHFNHLEMFFDKRPFPTYEGNVPIHLKEAVHPRAEVEGIAQEIIRLVRDEGYRFKDMAIFIREQDIYQELIATIFEDFEIPVFVDEKRVMLNHPLIEFIRSLLEMVESNWRYDAVFRVLKTGFIPASHKKYPLTNDAIDILENYVLEYGIKNRSGWHKKEPWTFQRFRGFSEASKTDAEKKFEEQINCYRNQVVHALKTFDKKIREVDTVKDRCETVYLLLEQLKIPGQLENIRTFYESEGELEKAREQEQVWEAIIQLLDELVEMAGDEQMTLTSYRSVLDAGFESLKFAHVPPSMDHVIVGTIDHSRIKAVKCAFLLGVNEGIWPMKPPTDGMISDEERDILKENGIELAESNRRKLLDDWFYMYLAFTRASNYLWVSYTLSDEEGNAKMPSQLIRRLQDLFKEVDTPTVLQDPDDIKASDRFITTPLKTRAALTSQLARYFRGYSINDVWWHVLNWYMNHEEKYSTSHNVLMSLNYKNKPTTLSAETVADIYPKKIDASVSRIEMFYQCSYKHFVQYNLNLDERRTYKLDAPDIGQLFHEALKIITEWIQDEGRHLGEVTREESKSYAKKAVVQLAPAMQNQILYSSNRYQYIQRKLQEVIARATYILSEQARLSGFTPVGLEIGFDRNDTLKPVTIPLPNGFELILRGRIDRVDKATYEDQLYLRIIDYKSSDQKLSLVEVYYGLALQMLTYLDVVLSQSEQWLGIEATPAGVLYFHVHNAMLSQENMLADDKLIDELFKEYKMKGILISDKEVVQLMDTSLETGTSQIVPAGFKKDGTFNAYSNIADEHTFSKLQDHVRQLMKQAGMLMTSGDIQINPFDYKDKNACTFCSFKSICQFDPILEENNYRKLTDIADKKVLEKIQRK